MPSPDEDVEIIDVRMELSDTDENIDEKLIEYHLKRASKKVRKEASSNADSGDLEEAIAIDAAYRLITSNKEAFIDAKDAAEVGKRWDVSEFIARLADRREEALEEVAEPWAVTVSGGGITTIY